MHIALLLGLIFATTDMALAAPWDPPESIAVKIKWDGDYPYNSIKTYDKSRRPSDVVNIRAGNSKNFQNGTPQERGAVTKDGYLEGFYWKPEGNDPFPFVIFLHGCGGMYATNTWAHSLARKLTAYNIGLLTLDSFKTRGVAENCGEIGGHWWHRRIDDAYSALDHLIENKLALKDRVIVMGQSNGGGTALRAMDSKYLVRKNRFAAAIPLEPTCLLTEGIRFYGPIKMIVAEKDNATPPEPCHKLAKMKHANPIQLVEIRGSLHGYLFPNNPIVTNKLGWRTGHDARGAAIGNEEILSFAKNPKAEAKIEYK